MPDKIEPISQAEWEKIATDLEKVAAEVKARPEVNHHFAERLTLIAKQMREDFIRPAAA